MNFHEELASQLNTPRRSAPQDEISLSAVEVQVEYARDTYHVDFVRRPTPAYRQVSHCRSYGYSGRTNCTVFGPTHLPSSEML